MIYVIQIKTHVSFFLHLNFGRKVQRLMTICGQIGPHFISSWLNCSIVLKVLIIANFGIPKYQNDKCL